MYIEKLNASLLGKDDNLVGINPLIMEKDATIFQLSQINRSLIFGATGIDFTSKVVATMWKLIIENFMKQLVLQTRR